MSQDGCFGAWKETYEMGSETLRIAKYVFFSESTPQFFYVSDIMVKELKLFAFYAMLYSRNSCKLHVDWVFLEPWCAFRTLSAQDEVECWKNV